MKRSERIEAIAAVILAIAIMLPVALAAMPIAPVIGWAVIGVGIAAAASILAA